MQNDDLVCDELAHEKRRDPQYFTVRVYLQDQAYGGPEEGGWYYRCGQFASEYGHLTRSFKFRNDAVQYRDALHDQYLDAVNKRRPSIHSVLSQGRYAAEVHAEEAPLFYPATRPHYE